MKVKMKSLFLLDYKKEKRQYERFLEELNSDILIYNYLSKHLKEELILSEGDDRIEKNKGYIVSVDGRKLIGCVCFYESDFKKFINLRYTIHPEYRKKGYGRHLLKEATDFSFQNFKEIEGVELLIHPENKRSIKIANSLGYQELENDKIKQYIKVRNS